jgi:hypothetical protein
VQRGGYCEVCARWVWVNSRGECQFGHPASSVREVQFLKPRAQDERPSSPVGRVDAATAGGAPGAAGDGTELVAYQAPAVPAVGGSAPSTAAPAAQAAAPAATRPFANVFPARKRSDGRWWWRHSLWIAWTFSLGFFNWIAFLFIGIRARRALWLLASLLYLLPMALTIASIGTGYLGLAIGFQLFMAGVSVLHAFVARPRYRAIMFGDPPLGVAPAPPPVLDRSSRRPLPRGLDADMAAVIRDAQQQVDEIAAAADGIEKPDVRHKAGLLCRTAEEILVELRTEPAQVPLARPFLSYYLEAAHRIVRGYADLSLRSFGSSETVDTLARAEASLDSIQRAFDSQLAGLLQHQVMDLDSEIALLEKTVQMDTLMDTAAMRPDPTPKTGGPR